MRASVMSLLILGLGWVLALWSAASGNVPGVVVSVLGSIAISFAISFVREEYVRFRK